MEPHVAQGPSWTKRKKIFVVAWAVLGAAGLSFVTYQFSRSAWTWFKGTYAHAFHSVGDKLVELERSHSENAYLRLENLKLRSKLKADQFRKAASAADGETSELAEELEEEAGTPIARTLASIDYHAPISLPHHQMLALAADYFKKGDYERSVVLMHRLLGRQDRNFRTPRNLLLTAVCWYHLDHLNHANRLLGELLKQPEERETLQYMAQGRLWKALTERKLDNKTESQKWLTELLDHHPHSIEASWINSREAKHGHGRKTASHH